MTDAKLPRSCEQHQPKYHGNAWKDYTLAELGQWVHLFVKRAHHRSDAVKRAKDLTDAQNYLYMMQAHIDVAVANKLTPFLCTVEPKTLLEVAQGTESEPVDSIRDAQGRVTRISTQADDPGYNPEIHLNQELKIFCDGVHFPTAHTADTVKGLVRYYEKNAEGRIKTQEVRGIVEIWGL